MRSVDCRLGGKAETIPLTASTPPREAPMTTMSRGRPVRPTGGPSRSPGSVLTIRSLLFLSRHSNRMSAVIRSTAAIADAARLRGNQVPGHLRHHLAKFIRLVTRAAQDRRHHLVRQKVVERCPGVVAFGAPMFMGDGEPRSVKSDVGFGTILDHLTPSWHIVEVRSTPPWTGAEQVGLDPNLRPITINQARCGKISVPSEALGGWVCRILSQSCRAGSGNITPRSLPALG